MYQNNGKYEPFEKKVWLSSPTMYSDSMDFVMEAYKTNWMSTVGKNIVKLSGWFARRLVVNMLWRFLAEQQHYIWR